MLSVQCPNCTATLSIDEEYAGQSGTCNKCGGAITVSENKATSQHLHWVILRWCGVLPSIFCVGLFLVAVKWALILALMAAFPDPEGPALAILTVVGVLFPFVEGFLVLLIAVMIVPGARRLVAVVVLAFFLVGGIMIAAQETGTAHIQAIANAWLAVAGGLLGFRKAGLRWRQVKDELTQIQEEIHASANCADVLSAPKELQLQPETIVDSPHTTISDSSATHAE